MVHRFCSRQANPWLPWARAFNSSPQYSPLFRIIIDLMSGWPDERVSYDHPTQKRSRAPRLYADRIAGGDCDHRDPCGDAFAGVNQGQAQSPRDRLYEQYEATGSWLALVRGGQSRSASLRLLCWSQL